MSKSKQGQDSNAPKTDGFDPAVFRKSVSDEGFTFLTEAEGPRLYLVKAPGVTIRGILRGRFPRPVKAGKPPQYFYEIEVTKGEVPCVKSELVEGQSEPVQTPFVASPGDIVRIDESYKVAERLQPFVDNEDEHEVMIRYVEKVKAGQGSVWRMDLAIRRLGSTYHKAF
ncbi:MAG: hypothetical protein HC888_06440 [Candidatus Competibacteraceae bacterium]|nr:hypothetical protein [Candidatus Competibacteraceae bacterium]